MPAQHVPQVSLPAAGRGTDPGPRPLRWGLQPITYGLTWAQALAAARAVDEHGFDYLWGHDHLWSTGGDPFQPFFEGWTTLAAWAAVTRRVHLGILVTANPFRNPGLVAKMTVSLDHISAGRAVLGMGAGNREGETLAHGLDAGRSTGERLDWLDEALTIIRRILEGQTLDHAGGHYRMSGVRQEPRPLQARVPILVGSGGERKGLRIVARHADLWHHWLGPDEIDVFVRKSDRLDAYLEEVGRPREAVERHVGGRLVLRRTEAQARGDFARQVALHGWDAGMTSFAWVGTSDQVVRWLRRYRDAGAMGFSPSIAAPLDLETIERLATEVRPALEAA